MGTAPEVGPAATVPLSNARLRMHHQRMRCLSHEAAKVLGVTPARVRQMAQRGELSAEVLAGGVRLFDLAEVEQLARRRAEQRHQPAERDLELAESRG